MFEPVPNGGATGGTLSQSRRGFTGHEHISVGNSGLIHMNGRVYDATLGRFTTADPFVQSPSFSQSYNRYSYGFNNPLSGTDPSGFGWFSKHFHAVHKAIVNPFNPQNVYGAIATRPHGSSHDRFMMTHSWARAIGYAAAGFYGGPYATAFISGYEAYITGGSNSDIFRASAISYVSSSAFSGVGAASSAVGGFWGAVIKIGGSAAVGCGSAAASGGNCRQGALVAGGFAAADVLFQYAEGKTDGLKQAACNAGESVCQKNQWDELRTDGAREPDWTGNPDRSTNALTESGMAPEASGRHIYDPDGLLANRHLARYINHVSKIHDLFNSVNYSRGGLFLSRGVVFDGAFQLYSFAGMPVAGALTAASYIGANPVLLSGQLEVQRRRNMSE